MRYRVVVICGLILSLMSSAVFPRPLSQTGRGAKRTDVDPDSQGGQKDEPKKKTLRKLADAEAASLFIHLIERYAKGVRDKNELDERIEQRLARTPQARETARRFAANFRGISIADRRVMFGEWADLSVEQKIPISQYRAAFSRWAQSAGSAQPATGQEQHSLRPRSSPVSQKHTRSGSPTTNPPVPGRRPTRPATNSNRPGVRSALPVLSQPRFNRTVFTAAVAGPVQRPDRFALHYEGMWCHAEADDDAVFDGPWNDEIYVVTQVIDSHGDDATTTHPRPHRPKWYEDVNDNDHRRGPRRRCWGGQDGKAAQDLTLIATAFEHDNGDVDVVAGIISLVGLVAAVLCFAGLGLAVGCAVAIVAAALLALWNILTGGVDDLISVVTVPITARQIRDWADDPPLLSRRGNLPYHFSTVHSGGSEAAGADYHFYFTVERVDR
jgi:hypothetical protein